MMRIFLVALVLFSLATPVYASNICGGATCTESEVGPFMKGITKQCGDLGDCQLTDIMQVFTNVGNWILGVVGAVVLLMYVYGGFMYMTAGAMEENMKKGKQALRISTIGLLIVFFAYAGITTLNSALRRGTIEEDVGQYVTCDPSGLNAGQACDLNSTCSDDGRCMTLCEQNHGDGERIEVNNGSEWFQYSCMDINDPPTVPGFSEMQGCEQNLCPGNEDYQCCLIHGNYNGGL